MIRTKWASLYHEEIMIEIDKAGVPGQKILMSPVDHLMLSAKLRTSIIMSVS